MDVLSKEEFELEKEDYEERILDGKLFIHPTDTIYGIGCNALNEMAVNRIRLVKKRHSMPFSILVPSKKWIYDNCILNGEAVRWVEKLPGPYTLVLRLKNRNAVPGAVNPGVDTIGVRIPDHWFSKVIAELRVPIITTSANIVGEQFMTSLDDLNSSIRAACDFAVYEGEKRGRPSQVVKLYEEEVELLQR